MAAWALAAMLALGGEAVQAASIEVSPVVHRLEAERHALVMTVRNRGEAPIAVQLRPFAWTQSAAGEQLEPAVDVTISPPIFQLEPIRK